MVDENANLEECFEDNPDIREPQIALLFEDTVGQLSKRWFMVGDDHLQGFKPIVINYLFNFEEADEEQIGALEAQFGPAEIVGLTYDMKPYNLGLKQAGSIDLKEMKACLDAMVTREYMADRFNEENPELPHSECVAQVAALTEQQIVDYKSAIITAHAEEVTEDELRDAIEAFYELDLKAEKEERERFLAVLAKDNQLSRVAVQRHRLAS